MSRCAAAAGVAAYSCPEDEPLRVSLRHRLTASIEAPIPPSDTLREAVERPLSASRSNERRSSPAASPPLEEVALAGARLPPCPSAERATISAAKAAAPSLGLSRMRARSFAKSSRLSSTNPNPNVSACSSSSWCSRCLPTRAGLTSPGLLLLAECGRVAPLGSCSATARPRPIGIAAIAPLPPTMRTLPSTGARALALMVISE
mmetsp:Transcript_39857/g.98575  ORF Transcript_39857/g.98575 Transcript_39857/m.98575 type:complete len:204 (+) Transcript_39857:212-823(+)